jgi:glycine dehydrogenase
MKRPAFNYDLSKLNREKLQYYIGADQSEIQSMLETVNCKRLEDLYSHIPQDNLFCETPNIGPSLEYEELADHLFELSLKNNIKTNFIGDGLPVWKETDIVGDICGIRGLTTAYTPYQPERSQGTLQTLWIYQCSLAELTGFEAINASLYERSTCMFEAINTAKRITKKKSTILVSSAIYPQDRSVLETMVKATKTKLIFIPINNHGLTDLHLIEKQLTENPDIAGVLFPQTNSFGLLENVDELTDLAEKFKVTSIAVIDPMLLGNGGLKKPSDFGSQQNGCDIIVGEGQHLALSANFGGPGLGIFGIRYNEKNKNAIRSTAGRYIGKAKDIFGRECKSIILSTREQHIRRDKATSNICSNQSFVASLAGACLLRRGAIGIEQSLQHARKNTESALQRLLKLDGVKLKYGHSFFHEVTLELDCNISALIDQASKAGLWIGADLTNRNDISANLLKITFTDDQDENDIDNLCSFFESKFKVTNEIVSIKLDSKFLNKSEHHQKQYSSQEVIAYYKELGGQNLSPDDGIYPLGSCTMKYNPYINDWAAGLEGFTKIHPQAPLADAQGCLEILFQIQEIFKTITGLAAVTTQPVAGAQGELVGIKMFQAFHKNNGESKERNIILIPKSAHGTNPATATVAGFETKKVDGKPQGILLIDANDEGEMDLDQIKKYCQDYGSNIAGIMVTNPNTAGIFEKNFKVMSELIHDVGGLVYMDGANMNAIASWVNLDAIGVDAVHNNLHKTWTIPHGGGGPGDAIVGVSSKLVNFLPGHQVIKAQHGFDVVKPKHSIGEFHRHWGNFAHKARAYTYLKALGSEGVRQMSATAVLSAQYLFQKLKKIAPILPAGSESNPRMHEFILTIKNETFEKIQTAGTTKAHAIARIGKLFLDFGFHAPTVAFPEVYGLMVEPTESFSKIELDEFFDVVCGIYMLIEENPEVLQSVPHFTPIDRVDEVSANKTPIVSEKISSLPEIIEDRVDVDELKQLDSSIIFEKINAAHIAWLEKQS